MMTNETMNCVVYNAAWWDVSRAVYRAVYWSLSDAVDRAVYWSVNGAIDQAMDEISLSNPTHPALSALSDFLAGAGAVEVLEAGGADDHVIELLTSAQAQLRHSG
jgi:hypothetical protein